VVPEDIIRQGFYHWVDISAGELLVPEDIIRQCFYHWVDIPAGGLLVPEGIIRQSFYHWVDTPIDIFNKPCQCRTLTPWRIIPSGTNSPPAGISTQW
jgi:hypothetical protein